MSNIKVIETPFQSTVNGLTGAMGPRGDAIYPFSTEMPNPWSLASQPLQIYGDRYIGAVDVNAGSTLPVYESVASAFGSKRRASKRRRVSRRKASKRRASRRKASKRRASKRRSSKRTRKVSRRRVSRRRRASKRRSSRKFGAHAQKKKSKI